VISDVEVRDAGRRGRGVFALRDFAPGEFIFRRWHGRVVTLEELDTLSDEDRMHLCELDWTTFAVLLPPGAYLNHSCDPNAMRSGVKVFAWRPIRAGDEVLIDYRLNATGASAGRASAVARAASATSRPAASSRWTSSGSVTTCLTLRDSFALNTVASTMRPAELLSCRAHGRCSH
jgi:hypothetical protein